MRAATRLSLLLIVACGTGCESLKRAFVTQEPQPTGVLEGRDANQFVTYLNQQAALMQSVRYDDVSISASDAQGSMPRLNEGVLACSKPRNFRLMAGHMLTSGSEVDVGSNSNEFWMYVKRPEQTFVYCNYEDFTQGRANLPIPFEPDWVLEVIGMNTYDDASNYEIDVNQKDRVYTLSFDSRTAKGEPIRKVIVFAGDRAGGEKPQVLRHAVYSQQGELMAWANVKQVRTIPVNGSSVQVPTRVTMEWPPQQFKMDLTLGRVQLNKPMNEKQFDYFYTRPNIAGANPINLANTEFRPSSYRGQQPSAGRPRLFGNR